MFTLGTRLTHVTRPLHQRDPDRAIIAAGRAIPDWSGGTRLAEGLKVFLDRWGRRGMARGAVVVLFSDHVSIEDERALKQLAAERGLLLMGPECGTAILDGVGLGFANVVQRGSVGPQPGGPHAGKRTIDTVLRLMEHPAFNLRNPNRARSLIFSFCSGNPAQFHAEDGSGYRFWADQVLALDAINPQVAARLARVMDRWQKYELALRDRMRAELERVAASSSLSRDVREIVGKALAA